MPPLTLVRPHDRPQPARSAAAEVPVRLLLAVTGRCDCADCCARHLAHPELGRLGPARLGLAACR